MTKKDMHVHILSDTTPYNTIGLLIDSMLD